MRDSKPVQQKLGEDNDSDEGQELFGDDTEATKEEKDLLCE